MQAFEEFRREVDEQKIAAEKNAEDARKLVEAIGDYAESIKYDGIDHDLSQKQQDIE